MAKCGIAITEAIKKYRQEPVRPGFVKHPVQFDKKDKLPVTESSDTKLRLGERRMLEVLVRWHPTKLTKAQLATLSKLTVTSGTFQAYYGNLKRLGLIDEVLGGRGVIVYPTEVGLKQAGSVAREPQTTEEIVQTWRSSLRAGERRLLDVLIEVYPKSMLTLDLATRAELTANAGTFQAYLGTLRRNGLAEVRNGEVIAGEALFLRSPR